VILKRWLKLFTTWLIKNSKRTIDSNIKELFDICRCLMQDVSIAKYLLPYLILNVVMYGSDENRDLIKKELLFILEESCKKNFKGSEHVQVIFSLIDIFTNWIQNYKNNLKTKKKIEKRLLEGKFNLI
jgi:serine/threonine-protein kinase ATR